MGSVKKIRHKEKSTSTGILFFWYSDPSNFVSRSVTSLNGKLQRNLLWIPDPLNRNYKTEASSPPPCVFGYLNTWCSMRLPLVFPTWSTIFPAPTEPPFIALWLHLVKRGWFTRFMTKAEAPNTPFVPRTAPVRIPTTCTSTFTALCAKIHTVYPICRFRSLICRTNLPRTTATLSLPAAAPPAPPDLCNTVAQWYCVCLNRV